MKIFNQKGFGLLEALIATAVASLVIASSFNAAVRYLHDIDDQTAAKQMHQIDSAFIRYTNDKFAVLLSATTATTPSVVSFTQLQAAGYIPVNLQNANSFKQTYELHLLQTIPGKLDGLVVTIGGDTINEGRIPRIATLTGAEGGYIPAAAPLTAKGSYGGWSVADTTNFWTGTNPNPGAGHLAATLSFSNSNVTDDYLYRNAVPGNASANQMNTAIDMNNNPLNNVSTATLTSVVATNAVCITNGTLAIDANGAVMSCVSGSYQPSGNKHWLDPVATYAALPLCDATSDGSTRIVMTPAAGSGARAYTCDFAAGKWDALGQDDNGNLALSSLTTGSLSAGSINTGSISTGTAQINAVATLGSGCSPNGLVAQDGTGMLLSCQNGLWKKATGSSAKQITSDAVNNYQNSVTTYAGSAGQNVGPFDPNGSNVIYTIDSSNQIVATYVPTNSSIYLCTIDPLVGGCSSNNNAYGSNAYSSYKPFLNGLYITKVIRCGGFQVQCGTNTVTVPWAS